MSCSCSSSPCQCASACDTANEPLSSVLTNLTSSLIGTPVKTCVNNQITWTMPCDLDAGIPDFPKNSGESVLCYVLRFMTWSISMNTGLKGYTTTALTNANVSLVPHSDTQDQDFTGTLTGPVNISLSSMGALEGDHFYLSFTGLNITAVNTLTIQTDSTNLLVLNSAGALTGYIKAVYTGSAWKLTLTSTNIV